MNGSFPINVYAALIELSVDLLEARVDWSDPPSHPLVADEGVFSLDVLSHCLMFDAFTLENELPSLLKKSV